MFPSSATRLKNPIQFLTCSPRTSAGQYPSSIVKLYELRLCCSSSGESSIKIFYERSDGNSMSRIVYPPNRTSKSYGIFAAISILLNKILISVNSGPPTSSVIHPPFSEDFSTKICQLLLNKISKKDAIKEAEESLKGQNELDAKVKLTDFYDNPRTISTDSVVIQTDNAEIVFSDVPLGIHPIYLDLKYQFLLNLAFQTFEARLTKIFNIHLKHYYFKHYRLALTNHCPKNCCPKTPKSS